MTLTSKQIEEFVETGCTIVRGAFSPEVAAAVCDRVWQEIETEFGVSRTDRATWKPLVHLCKAFTTEMTKRAWTPRFKGAIDDLLGAGRWHHKSSLGWFPVSLPGFDEAPWQVPQSGWHVDGQDFHHRVNSPDQGLLPLVILTDIAPGGGGTCIVPGSHQAVARMLAQAPDGLPYAELRGRASQLPLAGAVEITGQAGDVALLHPFMLHARSANTGEAVRIICNPCIHLREPMNLNGGAEESPLERSIREAIAPVAAA